MVHKRAAYGVSKLGNEDQREPARELRPAKLGVGNATVRIMG